MKTQEELRTLKNEIEALNKKLSELTEDELKEVTGGFTPIGQKGYTVPDNGEIDYDIVKL